MHFFHSKSLDPTQPAKSYWVWVTKRIESASIQLYNLRFTGDAKQEYHLITQQSWDIINYSGGWWWLHSWLMVYIWGPGEFHISDGLDPRTRCSIKSKAFQPDPTRIDLLRLHRDDRDDMLPKIIYNSMLSLCHLCRSNLVVLPTHREAGHLWRFPSPRWWCKRLQHDHVTWIG